MDLKLSNDSIVEALFELRFNSTFAMPSSAFAGLLYSKLRSEYPKFEELPAASVPEDVRTKDPRFRYSPTHRLTGDNYSVSVGESVCVVSCRKPYGHWEHFKPKIESVLNEVKEIGVVESVERTGLRYINIIPNGVDPKAQFSNLQFVASLADLDLCEYMTSIRTEIPSGRFVNIVTVSANGEAVSSDNRDSVRGLIFDIDTICKGPLLDFWSEVSDLLEEAHAVEKEIFFKGLSESGKDFLK
ncbi:TIGR04255 family protein [Marinobacter sp. W-8]|uniref:TIGR04255 family protein n=1 Tax=Marinobacter sp. W-8 TaxID=3369658 RepID=UPI0037C53B2F